MSEELNNQKQLLNAYKLTFASKKGFSNPSSWYPRTAKEIDNLLKSFIKDFSDAKKFEKELKDFLETSYAQVIENDVTLIAKKRDHIPWLDDKRKVWKNANSTNSQFAWYKSKSGFKLGNAFDDLDDSTDEILSLLEDPTRHGKWMTRGMIVGDVQSGKTSHYNGLINKAVDTGYKLIIVLSGSYNALRAQTQKRIEDNTIKTTQPGQLNKVFFATSKPDYIYKEGLRIIQAENDFSASTAKQISMTNLDPTILVVKKHVSVLANILMWLNKQDGMEKTEKEWEWKESKWKNDTHRQLLPKHQLACDQPLLVIDDECDSASIDISPRKTKGTQDEWDEEKQEEFKKIDPSKTNQLIRRILMCFKRSTYIGYTATPLANAFINYSSYKHDEGLDIFPKDFIRLLKRYEDHIGPEDVFGIAEKNYDPDEEVVSLSENIDKNEFPQVKWVYDYRNDHDDPIFKKEDGTIDEEARDKKYREEAKDGDEIKGWLPLYHKNGAQCLYKEEDIIPPSLREAINTFLINIAVRYLRKKVNNHNSMLIHVSRFKNVQGNVFNQVKKYLDQLKKNVQYGQDKKIKEIIKNEFDNIWNHDIQKNINLTKFPESKKFKFDSIWNKILEVITSENNPLDIVQINSQSDDILDYDRHKNGWNVIVIGGAAISRGITLEGLTVSYFTRVAKLPTSDTLIQMGRWFGYRKGYEDLWRVYVPKVLHILFRQFSFTMEKAREKFQDLSEQNRSPADYAIEVPCFPGWNLVSKTKARDIKIIPEPYSSFTATSRTPVMYYKDEKRIENIELTKSLINSLPSKFETEIEINKKLKEGKIWNPIPFDDEKIDNTLPIEEIREKVFKKGYDQVKLRKAYLWRNVDVNKIIKYFGNYKCPPTQEWTCKIIAAQIKALNEFKKISNWNIGIFSINQGPKYSNLKFEKNNIEVALQQRSIKTPYSNFFSIKTLSDPNAEFADVDAEEYNKGIEGWLNLYKKTGKCVIKRRKINFLPAQFKQKLRQRRKEGLLIIYPWSTKFKEQFNPEKDVYIGWQIITPPSRNEDDDDKLIYNVAMNQAAREHREAEYKEFFNPDLFS
mgnify:FL=1|tara:strand:+ start:211 stop:3432 length:3222 start_codon:yes stop_codon:yes gene_type:complete